MMEKKRRVTKAYFEFARNHYKSLIRKLSFSLGVDLIHVEELQSRGDEELLKCMICYNNNGSFITFLYHRLKGTFRHLRDMENRARRFNSTPINSISDIVGSDNNTDSNMMAQECLDFLDLEERQIIVERFFNGKTTRMIAIEQDTVASSICRITNRAIDKMRQKCGIELGLE